MAFWGGRRPATGRELEPREGWAGRPARKAVGPVEKGLAVGTWSEWT